MKKIIFFILIFAISSCKKNVADSENIFVKKNHSDFRLEGVDNESDYPLTEISVNGKILSVREFKGNFLFQGDIVITPDQINKLSKRGAGLTNLASRWPNGIIPYKISSSLPNQYRVHGAISHWEEKTTLDFVPYTGQTNYIEFVWNSTSTFSFLGMIGNRQEINLANWATTGSTIHEIGHAVGVFHEQSRADRDSHITVHYNNIDPPLIHNFNKYGSGQGFDYGTFDFGSIMIYSSFAGSKNGSPTITKKNGDTYVAQRNGLSITDIKTINDEMYRPSWFWTAYYKGDYDWKIGDFNGDGKDDLLRYVNGFGFQVLTSNGSRFQNATTWSTYNVGTGGNFLIGDFNGDNKDDIIRWVNGSGFQVLTSTGSSFNNAVTWSGYNRGTGNEYQVADFNGDGKDDILRWVSGTGFQVLTSSGFSFNNANTWSGYSRGTYSNFETADFNGDGKSDIIRWVSGSGFQVLISSGSSFNNASTWSNYNWGTDNDYKISDFNGDGKSDILRWVSGSGFQVLSSTGSSFNNAVVWSNYNKGTDNKYFTGDFNGDGKNDLCRYLLTKQCGADVFTSTGSSFSH